MSVLTNPAGVNILSSMTRTLDQQLGMLRAGEGANVVAALCSALLPLRMSLSDGEWKAVKSACLAHPICPLLHEDPYTRRAFEKPRGYAGDAVMLDYIYDSMPPEGTSEIGRQVFAGTTGLSNGKSVTFRRDFLAQRIDQMALAKERLRVLSLACGHLREGQQSQAVLNRAVGTLYAVDQDVESLRVVEQEQAERGVTPVHGSVVSIIRKKMVFPDIDFAYAAGLYDYLSDSLAAKTTKALFDMLAPGGCLLLANYVPSSHGRGYMDAFMDWSLVYRSEQDFQTVTSLVPDSLIDSRRSYYDPYGNVVYLELVRA